MPGDDDVLVEVHAASVNATDVENMRGVFIVRIGAPLRPRYKILGSDVAGRVEAVGSSVTAFRPGDEVFGDLSPLQGSFGAFAEYVCAREDTLARKPDWLTFQRAAALPSAGIIALQALRNHKQVQPEHEILINGAGGSVGTFAVQIAQSFGAEVTAVDSAEKLEMLRSIGADHVIDYTKEDFTQGRQRYDLILDNVGNHPFSDLRRALTPQGVIQPNTGHAGMGYILRALMLSLVLRQQASMFVAVPTHEELVVLKELIEAGKVTRRSLPEPIRSARSPTRCAISTRATQAAKSSSPCVTADKDIASAWRDAGYVKDPWPPGQVVIPARQPAVSSTNHVASTESG